MTNKGINETAYISCGVIVILLMLIPFANLYGLMKVEKTLKNEEARLEVLQKNVRMLTTSKKRLIKEKEEFSELLFQDRDIPDFLDDISQMSRNLNLNILDMKTKDFYIITPEEEDDGSQNKTEETVQEVLSALPIDIKVTGPFTSIVQLFDEIENYRQITNIKNIRIRNIKKYPTLECFFTIVIYSLKQQQMVQK